MKHIYHKLTCIFGKLAPIPAAIFTNISSQLLIFFHGPCSLLQSTHITAWCSHHLSSLSDLYYLWSQLSCWWQKISKEFRIYREKWSGKCRSGNVQHALMKSEKVWNENRTRAGRGRKPYPTLRAPPWRLWKA